MLAADIASVMEGRNRTYQGQKTPLQYSRKVSPCLCDLIGVCGLMQWVSVSLFAAFERFQNRVGLLDFQARIAPTLLWSYLCFINKDGLEERVK